MSKIKAVTSFKPTKDEAKYMSDLLMKIKSDIKSSKDLGIRVSKNDEKIVDGLRIKFAAVL